MKLVGHSWKLPMKSVTCITYNTYYLRISLVYIHTRTYADLHRSVLWLCSSLSCFMQCSNAIAAALRCLNTSSCCFSRNCLCRLLAQWRCMCAGYTHTSTLVHNSQSRLPRQTSHTTSGKWISKQIICLPWPKPKALPGGTAGKQRLQRQRQEQQQQRVH